MSVGKMFFNHKSWAFQLTSEIFVKLPQEQSRRLVLLRRRRQLRRRSVQPAARIRRSCRRIFSAIRQSVGRRICRRTAVVSGGRLCRQFQVDVFEKFRDLRRTVDSAGSRDRWIGKFLKAKTFYKRWNFLSCSLKRCMLEAEEGILYCHLRLDTEWRKRTSILKPGNTNGGSITVPLTSCLTGLESAVWQLTIFLFICKTD